MAEGIITRTVSGSVTDAVKKEVLKSIFDSLTGGSVGAYYVDENINLVHKVTGIANSELYNRFSGLASYSSVTDPVTKVTTSTIKIGYAKSGSGDVVFFSPTSLGNAVGFMHSNGISMQTWTNAYYVANDKRYIGGYTGFQFVTVYGTTGAHFFKDRSSSIVCMPAIFVGALYDSDTETQFPEISNKLYVATIGAESIDREVGALFKIDGRKGVIVGHNNVDGDLVLLYE